MNYFLPMGSNQPIAACKKLHSSPQIGQFHVKQYLVLLAHQHQAVSGLPLFDRPRLAHSGP